MHRSHRHSLPGRRLRTEEDRKGREGGREDVLSTYYGPAALRVTVRHFYFNSNTKKALEDSLSFAVYTLLLPNLPPLPGPGERASLTSGHRKAGRF